MNEHEYLSFLCRQVNSMNFYCNDIHAYNIALNNYRYFLSKYKMRHKGSEYPTISSKMSALNSKIGHPYDGRKKITTTPFMWRNCNWTFNNKN